MSLTSIETTLSTLTPSELKNVQSYVDNYVGFLKETSNIQTNLDNTNSASTQTINNLITSAQNDINNLENNFGNNLLDISGNTSNN